MTNQCETPDYKDGPCHCRFHDPERYTVTRSPVIAYTVGSFWYCPDHGRSREDASATRLNQLIEGVDYRCDTCGVSIPSSTQSERLAAKMEVFAKTHNLEAPYSMERALEVADKWHSIAENWASACDELRRENANLKEALNSSYTQRSQLLAWQAAQEIEQHGGLGDIGSISRVILTAATDVEEEGWCILYLHTEQGQLSWHISPDDMRYFGFLKINSGTSIRWDGHTTEEKYDRITRLVKCLLTPCIFHDKPYKNHDFTYGPECRRCGFQP